MTGLGARAVRVASDVTCEVAVVLGTRSACRCGECLYLTPKTVMIALEQLTGRLRPPRPHVNGVQIAHGEVAVVDDSTNIRLTSIVAAAERGGN